MSLHEDTLAVPSHWYDNEYFAGNGTKSCWHGEVEDWRAWVKPALETVYRLSHTFPQAQSFLDIGCGRAQAVYGLRMAGKTAYGVEWSNAGCRRRLSPYVYRASAWHLPFATHSMDVAFSCDLLEHIPTEHIPDVLREAHRVGKNVCHWISVCTNNDVGDARHFPDQDQSHVSVFTPTWWARMFADTFPDQTFFLASLTADITPYERYWGGLLVVNGHAQLEAWREYFRLEKMKCRKETRLIARDVCFSVSRGTISCMPLSSFLEGHAG